VTERGIEARKFGCKPGFLAFSFLLSVTAVGQQNAPEATFRAGTELVQVSVVAQDKNGKAVTDLRREDFQIFDNGVQQEIRLFLADRLTPAPAVAIPAGVFTNLITPDAGAGYAVLLFDNLNVDPGRTVFAHTARARQKALQALRAMPSGEKIAIYALGCRFHVFREFTSDQDLLLKQLETLGPAPDPCLDPSNDGPEHGLTANRGRARVPTLFEIHEQEGASDVAAGINADKGDAQIKQLAEHLAGIPGRKNLIWLTTTFRLTPTNLQALMGANVAIYPVDTIGSTIGLSRDKEMHAAPMRALAAITGGKAYVDRDDLDVAIGDALNDGHISYTLGFYRPDGDRSAAVHRIEIRTRREAVALRYRTSYSVVSARPKLANPVQVLVDAIDRPVNATAIPMMAVATRSEHTLSLAITLDVSALDLEQKNGLWEGRAELLARFMGNDGKIAGKIIPLTLNFHLRPVTYAAALERGYRYRTEIVIPPKAVDLNLLVGNLASGKIGTVTIPLSEVKR
jgi:VWFA-related protein